MHLKKRKKVYLSKNSFFPCQHRPLASRAVQSRLSDREDMDKVCLYRAVSNKTAATDSQPFQSAEEMSGVPHHLFFFFSPDSVLN